MTNESNKTQVDYTLYLVTDRKLMSSASIEEGYAFLETLKAPYVIKADGLAA